MVPTSGRNYSEGWVNGMGWISQFALLVLWGTSQPFFRNQHYQSFLWIHLLSAFAFIVFGNLHDYNTLHFVQPAIAAWIADRFLRYSSACNISSSSTLSSSSDDDAPQQQQLAGTTNTSGANNHSSGDVDSGINDSNADGQRSGFLVIRTPSPTTTTTTITDVDGVRVVRLTFDIPRHWPPPETIIPGSFLYLKNNTMTLSRGRCNSDGSSMIAESHPYSISSIDHDLRTVTIHVKDLGDWSNKLVNKITQLVAASTYAYSLSESEQRHGNDDDLVALEIEGPYGGTDPCAGFANCLFLAGGVGVTAISEVMFRRHCRGCGGGGESSSPPQQQTLVWLVRTLEEAQFLFADILSRLLADDDDGDADERGGNHFQATRIKIYITQQQEPSSSSSMAPSGTEHGQSLPDGAAEAPSSLIASASSSTRSTTITLPVQYKDCSSNHFARAGGTVTLFACTVGIAISFLLARLVSCNRRTVRFFPDGPSYVPVYVSVCSLLGSSTQTCVYCPPGEDDDHHTPHYVTLSCCTVETCYLAFRGIPIVFAFLVTPLVAYVIVVAKQRIVTWREKLQHFCYESLWFLSRRDDGGFLELPNHEEVPGSIYPPCNHQILFSQHHHGRLELEDKEEDLPALANNSTNLTIEFKRPILEDIVEDFCNKTMQQVRSTESTASAAVVVCGSEGLVAGASLALENRRKATNYDGMSPPALIIHSAY